MSPRSRLSEHQQCNEATSGGSGFSAAKCTLLELCSASCKEFAASEAVFRASAGQQESWMGPRAAAHLFLSSLAADSEVFYPLLLVGGTGRIVPQIETITL
jgi:hypothetical protein